ncbi:MAG: helix-turn-helix domain-containing protein [Acidobacteria bacterium]|nr:helix-turn-helix domain-containing protein [Acidobacteriota bacterium]
MDRDADVTVEFLVEPFSEGAPGQHVDAAAAAFADQGVKVEFGAFASSATTELDRAADAVAAMIRNAFAKGATRLRIQIGRDLEAMSIGDLHNALGDMFADLERESSIPVHEWNRTQKQAAIRRLSERGAFLLRGSIDDVATLMGVSRITIYNYLNAIESP